MRKEIMQSQQNIFASNLWLTVKSIVFKFELLGYCPFCSALPAVFKACFLLIAYECVTFEVLKNLFILG
jgi:hypothetical protein